MAFLVSVDVALVFDMGEGVAGADFPVRDDFAGHFGAFGRAGANGFSALEMKPSFKPSLTLFLLKNFYVVSFNEFGISQLAKLKHCTII